MAMPKGFKSENGYATVTGTEGYGYREIAEKMTSHGVKMNHATARNYFLRAMKKVATPLASISERSIDNLIVDPGFQEAVATLIREKKLCISK